MSPRKNRRPAPGPKPEAGGGSYWDQSTEEGADGDWIVRTIAGANAVKAYRCPGCDQEIPPGVGHLVVWPADGRGGADDRRHWHRPCWNARGRRTPRIQRSRNAPRY
ncbi:ATP/GTP-binding protein [Actinomadura rudentiformis]|uniref:ATP/GTP-binding protein n=1 Tax=Actinomadura rudentiformis TaxID=359158 RepID=A0A6H9YW52_9ACTN|nr:ATP/GTP-binding protein [Actinomadura rudentiformis]KAB2345979.1 ATP/GTP-binding protein [Actinomadura rudentiformis]